MFQDIPFTAYLICYGPLVLTVGGFIAYAAITDADARRKYLRRMETRPDDQVAPVEGPIKIESVKEAETPSGTRVRIEPAEDES